MEKTKQGRVIYEIAQNVNEAEQLAAAGFGYESRVAAQKALKARRHGQFLSQQTAGNRMSEAQ